MIWMDCACNWLKLANKPSILAIATALFLLGAVGCSLPSTLFGGDRNVPVQLEFSNENHLYASYSPYNDDTTRVNVRFCQLKDTLLPSYRAINDSLLRTIISVVQWSSPLEEEEKKPTTDVKTAINGFIEAYKRSVSEGFPLAWDLYADCTFEGTLDSLIQFSCNVESMTGGAHPYRWTNFHLYSLRSGKEIYPADYLRDTMELRNLLIQKVRIAFEATDKNLLEIGIYEEYAEGFPIAENIAITSSGATILYNNYEIAPYYLGPIELQLTMEETRKYFDLRALKRH